MPSIADIKAAAAAKTAALMKSSPGNAAKNLAEELAKDKPVEIPKESTGTRRYFNKIPSSRFIFSDGVEVYFHFGRLDVGPENKAYPSMVTMWKAYQQELNAILGNNPSIFVTNDEIETPPEVKQNAVGEGDVVQADSNLPKNAKIRQEIGNVVGTGQPTDVNQSTTDPALRAAMMGPITTEGAQERATTQNASAAPSA